MSVIYHCIDAEAWCRAIVNGGLASLGMCTCLVDEKKNIVVRELKRVSINIRWPYGSTSDPETDAMWTKFPDACQQNQQNQMDPVTAAIVLQNEIQTTREVAHRNKWTYRLVLDNPAFDLLWFDFFMSQYSPGCLPFRHHHITGYIHNLIDVSQRKRAMIDLGINLRLAEFQPSVPHDHTPGNDSRCTIEEWLHCRKIIASNRLKLKHNA